MKKIDELRLFSEALPPYLVDGRDSALRRALKVQLYCTLVTACFAARRAEMPNFQRAELMALRHRAEALAKELGFTIQPEQGLPGMLAEPLRELLGDG